jgi:hypothetical protein
MRYSAILVLVVAFFALFGAKAQAVELTGFLSLATPGDKWAGGGGGTFAIGFFHVASFEVEGAYMPGESTGVKMRSLTGSAFLAPSLGKLVPYVGLGVGVARQENASRETDDFAIHTFALGAKYHIAPLILIKAEYRKISLPDDAVIPFDNRYSLGAGISF